MDYYFPPIPDKTQLPIWTGHGFKVGEEILPILSYEKSTSGWTDDLTTFHEATAGESHFIDRASRMHAISQIRKYVSVRNPVILDIGCSSGFLIENLRTEYPNSFIAGTDVVMGPLMNISKKDPSIPLLHFDLARCPLPDNSVDVVVLLNVLEHIENDQLAIHHLYRILKPGGVAVIEVPANPNLFDIYDKLLMHYRRYRLQDLRELFLNENFSVLEESHLGFFIYPGFYMIKQLQRIKQSKIKNEDIPARVSRNITATRNNLIFEALMNIELWLGSVASYPFGIRCLITCKKISLGFPDTVRATP